MSRWKAVLKVHVIGISNKAEEFVYELARLSEMGEGGGGVDFMWKTLPKKQPQILVGINSRNMLYLKQLCKLTFFHAPKKIEPKLPKLKTKSYLGL